MIFVLCAVALFDILNTEFSRPFRNEAKKSVQSVQSV